MLDASHFLNQSLILYKNWLSSIYYTNWSLSSSVSFHILSNYCLFASSSPSFSLMTGMALLARKSMLWITRQISYKNLGIFLPVAIPNLNNTYINSYFTYISSFNTTKLFICSVLCTNFFAFLKYLNTFLII